MLPAHHPLSRHVRRVASRILSASNLGVLRGSGDASLQQAPYVGSLGGGGDGWNPDTELPQKSPQGAGLGSEREWEVMVVNDSKMVNAQAMPGE